MNFKENGIIRLFGGSFDEIYENQSMLGMNAVVNIFRLEGNRHPHSWSIVEPHNCIQWIMESFHTINLK